MRASDPVPNQLVGRQALAPALDASSVGAEIAFDAPATAGEYKVIVHVRSSSMVGVDSKRRISFVVRAKRPAPPSSSSGTSTELAEGVEAMEAAIADLQCDEDASMNGTAAVTPVAEQPDLEAVAIA